MYWSGAAAHPLFLLLHFFFLFISISSRLVGYSSFPAPWPPLFIGWAPVPPLCTLAPCGACFCLSPAETTPVCENVNYNKHLFNDMQPLPVFPVASSPSVQCSSVEPEFSDWRCGPFMYQSCVFEAHTNKRFLFYSLVYFSWDQDGELNTVNNRPLSCSLGGAELVRSMVSVKYVAAGSPSWCCG